MTNSTRRRRGRASTYFIVVLAFLGATAASGWMMRDRLTAMLSAQITPLQNLTSGGDGKDEKWKQEVRAFWDAMETSKQVSRKEHALQALADHANASESEMTPEANHPTVSRGGIIIRPGAEGGLALDAPPTGDDGSFHGQIEGSGTRQTFNGQPRIYAPTTPSEPRKTERSEARSSAR